MPFPLGQKRRNYISICQLICACKRPNAARNLDIPGRVQARIYKTGCQTLAIVNWADLFFKGDHNRPHISK